MNSNNSNSPDPVAHLRLLSMKTVCEILGVRPQTVYRWIRKGTFFPPIRFSENRIAFNQAHFEAWLAAKHPRRSDNDNDPMKA